VHVYAVTAPGCQVTVDLDKGFDRELGSEYVDLTADGGRARVRIEEYLIR
jgi:hypothetical protein